MTRSDPLIGKTVAGRYTIVRKIGRGGMGMIYEVQHTRLGRKFALKTLSGDLAMDPEALARFQREADAIAQLRHPNIVEVVDWDTLDDGSPCMIMELLEGEDLAAYLRRSGPMPWTALARIADQVLSALATAHRAGITHRDIKPQNVFLASDDTGEIRVKLLDFGVSKFHENHSVLTGDQQILGTPAHMSPEQIEGAVDKIGPASDVWAMATLLFEMAAGRPAFQGATVPAVLYQVCHGSAPSVSTHRSDTPPAFDALVARAVSREPAVRTRSIDRLRAELRAALGDLAPAAFVEPLRTSSPDSLRTVPHEPVSASTMTRASGQLGRAARTIDEPSGRRRWVLAGVAAAASLLVIAAVLLSRDIATSRRSAAPIAATEGGTDAAVRTIAPLAPPDAGVGDADATPSAPTPRELVKVRVESIPTGAIILEDRKNVGRTPWTTETALGGSRPLTIHRAGYEDEVIRLDGRLARVRVELSKKAVKRQTKPPPKPPPPKPDDPKRTGDPKWADPDEVYGQKKPH